MAAFDSGQPAGKYGANVGVEEMSRRLLLSLILLATNPLAATAQEQTRKVGEYVYIGLFGDSGTEKDEQEPSHGN